MIKLEYYRGRDRVCNYCNKYRRADNDPTAEFYEMRRDGNNNTTIMLICEYCARSLYQQLSEMVKKEG